MRYRLHNRLGSGGFVIETALTIAGVPFDYEPLNSDPSTPVGELIQNQNPWGQVPVLETPDGDVLTETAAMMFYLADRHDALRDGPTFSVQNQAAYYRWTVFLTVNVYEGILRRCYPDRYVTGKNAQSELIESANARVHKAFRLLENELKTRPCLCGDALSLADVFFAMLYAWHKEKPDLPRCTALTESVAQHPEVSPIWHRNFGHRLKRQWGRTDG